MTNSTPGKRIYQILTAPMRDIPPGTDVTRPRLHLHDRFFNNGAPFSVYPFFKFYFFHKTFQNFFIRWLLFRLDRLSLASGPIEYDKKGVTYAGGGDWEPPLFSFVIGRHPSTVATINRDVKERTDFFLFGGMRKRPGRES